MNFLRLKKLIGAAAGRVYRRRSTAILVAAIGFGALPIACAPPAPRPATNIVRQIDHILIASSDTKGLFALLSETFQFPVAWPMSDYGNFASGGVAVGNVNLEIIKDSPGSPGNLKSRWTGFALEPEPLRISVPELDIRGIPHGKPAPFKSGWFTTRWTTVGLPSVSSDATQVFLCQYEDDQAARRRRLLEQVQARGGGPLSVLSVREIVCGAEDVKRTQGQWQTLLNPLPLTAQGAWPLGAGPALRVVQAKQDGIQRLVITVKSLAQARRFLKEQGLLGAEEPQSITLEGPLLQGLNMTLVEPAVAPQ